MNMDEDDWNVNNSDSNSSDDKNDTLSSADTEKLEE
jgi:hypothetical protein